MKLGSIGVIVAARTLSARLPGKALLPLRGTPMILFLLRRLRRLTDARIILATTQLASDDRLASVVEAEGYTVFRGAADDVVARYVAASDRFGFDTAVRVTGDCPFVDAALVSRCLKQAAAFDDFDLATTKRRFPVGLDVEIFRAQRLAALHSGGGLTPPQREHLTLCFYDRRDEFVVRELEPPAAWRRSIRQFTVDTPEDYVAAAELLRGLDSDDFSVDALIARAA
jgi:spore coat polysaccharide biosynthesis protein SpsF (cytidylyltransferase family)